MDKWSPGESVGLRLDQVGDSSRSAENLESMFAEIGKVISSYGFKIRQRGEWTSFRRSAAEEEKYIERLLKGSDSG